MGERVLYSLGYEEIRRIPKVDKIQIKDYGIIKNADIKFRDKLNIITGKRCTGKTTVIKFLRENFSNENLSSGERAMLQIDNILGIDNQTILMDDFLFCLDEKNLIKALDKLSKSGKQVIIALGDHILSEIKDKIKGKINIINTKDFKLKGRNEM